MPTIVPCLVEIPVLIRRYRARLYTILIPVLFAHCTILLVCIYFSISGLHLTI